MIIDFDTKLVSIGRVGKDKEALEPVCSVLLLVMCSSRQWMWHK